MTSLHLRKSIGRSLSGRCGFVLVPLALVCFALVQNTQALLPAPSPDGGYPGGNTAEGINALHDVNTAVGINNTAVGANALTHDTTGQYNVAVGSGALASNTTGDFNMAIGTEALTNNNASFNLAIGFRVLFMNTTGRHLTGIGAAALRNNTTASFNTAIGATAMRENTTGEQNTAIGADALRENTIGEQNTAVGSGALSQSTGSGNTALGRLAGVNMTMGSNNICIGSPGDGIPSPASNRCFIGNIRDRFVGNGDGIAVIVDSDGQLGTANASSRRFKKDIKPMDQSSEAILRLKPVTFHYKNRDTKKADDTPQFGLVAEDVAEVNPDLVMRDKDGQISYVRYDAVNVMLLNEFLKEHKKVKALEATVARQQKGMEVLIAQLKEQAAQIQKVSAQLEVSKPVPQVVNNP